MPVSWSFCSKLIQKLLLAAWAKPIFLCVLLIPLGGWIWGVWFDTLGANPAEFLIRASGDWALRCLCVVLAITPLRECFGWPVMARFRRMAGVLTYFYASLHLLAYAWLDMGFEWQELVHDLAKRPFILVGFLTWLLMTPLAITSFNAAIRALGGQRWRLLHRMIYALAPLGILHFFWMRASKQRFAEVAIYALVFAALLLWRVVRLLRKRSSAAHGAQ